MLREAASWLLLSMTPVLRQSAFDPSQCEFAFRPFDVSWGTCTDMRWSELSRTPTKSIFTRAH